MAHAVGRSVGRSVTSCIGENGTHHHLPNAKAFGTLFWNISSLNTHFQRSILTQIGFGFWYSLTARQVFVAFANHANPVSLSFG